MKIATLFLFIILVENTNQEIFRLNGKYKFVPEFPERSQIYLIDFKDSIYVKTLPNGGTNRGVVQYGKNSIYLRDYERELKFVNSQTVNMETNKPKEMDLIALKTGKQDSIAYSHHAYHEGGPASWLHITDESGKLIKVK